MMLYPEWGEPTLAFYTIYVHTSKLYIRLGVCLINHKKHEQELYEYVTKRQQCLKRVMISTKKYPSIYLYHKVCLSKILYHRDVT